MPKSTTRNDSDKDKKKDADSSTTQKPQERLPLDGTGETRIVERVYTVGGRSMDPPMLTKTNYSEWSLVMKVQMEAEGHWAMTGGHWRSSLRGCRRS